MKYIEFNGNTRDCNFTYFRTREGKNYFVSYYKHSSRLIYDPKTCWRILDCAKFTDTGKALKEWCLEMDATYGVQPTDEEGRKDTSFASEAIAEEEPNDNTKMIT